MRVHPIWIRVFVNLEGAEDPLGHIAAVGWSDTDTDDARRRALEQAQRIVTHLRGGVQPDRYPYGERGLREEILMEHTAPDGSRTAVLTRNRYGAVVLNATSLAIADIDSPQGKSVTPDDIVAGQITAVANDLNIGVHLYRTAAGHRAIITNRTFDPTAPEADQLLAALRSDPMYRTLTRVQECFRARLTPKPWRMGQQALGISFPYDTRVANRATAWLEEYAQRGAQYGVAVPVVHIGDPTVLPELQELITVHDTMAVRPGLPLA